jgi:hypothetical protein
MFTNKPELIKRYAPFIPGITAPLTKHTDAPAQCIRVNIEWLELIAGALETLTFPDLYTGTDEERQNAAQEAVNLIGSVLDGNMSCEEDALQLAQGIIDPCVLYASYDGGVTWNPVFDFSKCARRQPQVTVTIDNYNDYRQTNTTNMAVYNGDIVNVAPEWQYGDPDDVWRDMALCWAAERWIELIVAIAITAGEKSVEETQDYLRTASEIASEISMFLTQLVKMEVYPVASQTGAWVFALASIVLDFVSEFQQFDASALLDEAAQTVVACVIYDALAGTKPTYAAWSTALASHGLIGNEGQIADAASLLMQSEEVFVEYLMIAADVVPAAELAGDLGCPCDDSWEVLVDLTASTLPDYLTIDWGLHEPGIGVTVVPHQAQGYNQKSANLSFTPLTTLWTLTNFLIEYAALAWGDLPNSYPGIVIQGTRFNPPEYYLAYQWLRSQISTGAATKQVDLSVSGVVTLGVLVRVSKFDPTGECAIRTIRLRGLGQNPFV